MTNKYQKHIERLQKACKRHQNLSEEEKDKRQKKGPRNISKYYRRKKRKNVSVLSGMYTETTWS